MPSKITGFKAKLLVNDGASQAYVAFTDAFTISLPELSYDIIDVTTLSDTREKRILSPLQKSGMAKCSMYWTAANFDRIRVLLGKTQQTPTVKTKFRVTTPDEDATGALFGKTLDWDGVVCRLGEISFDKSTTEAIKFDFDIMVDGDIVATDSPNET